MCKISLIVMVINSKIIKRVKRGDDMAAIKHSRQRDAILTFLISRKDHPTAEVVYENVRREFPKIRDMRLRFRVMTARCILTAM